jgi:hypothetical protein
VCFCGGLKYFHNFSNFSNENFVPPLISKQTQTRDYITLSKIELHVELVWNLPKSNKLHNYSELTDTAAGTCSVLAMCDERQSALYRTDGLKWMQFEFH